MSENAPFKGDHHHDASESWLAAIAYLPVLCFIPYFFYGSRSFVAYHARQGVLLFLLEVVGALTLLAVDMSIGRIPFLGFLVIFMLRLVYYLPILALIVLGFAKALTGEIGPLPWVGHWAERIPPARSGD